MKCPNCGEELFANVKVIMNIPSSMVSLLSKKNIAKKEVQILGVYWDSAYYYCKNETCKNRRFNL